MVLIHAPRNSAFGGSTDSVETEADKDKAEADTEAEAETETETAEDEAEAEADADEAEADAAEDEEAEAGNKVISESKIVSIRLLPFINITLLCSKT